MTVSYSSTVDAALGDVFAWHARPGAVSRLTPPWEPIRVKQEAESLQNGRTVFSVPGGLEWVAQHQPDLYDPPNQFADELVSQPLAAALRWRHIHEFTASLEGGTRVHDQIETTVPGRVLTPILAYRHRQLAGDLASQRRADAFEGSVPGGLQVAITGASGLVGSALCAFLSTGGHRVIRLVRHPAGDPDERRWDPDRPDPRLLDGVDAVVHLAGASIAGRFGPGHKRAIRDSRIGPTRWLAEIAARSAEAGGRLRCFVSASAIGYYGNDAGDAAVTEESPRGEGFLAGVVADWEEASERVRHAGVRTVHLRTGIVQSPRGGVLRLLRPLFTVGLGGRLGTGRQWTSWIGIDDLVDIYLRALLDPGLSGPVNAVAPEAVSNREYTEVLARVLRRPAALPVPALGPQLLLGREGAAELALASQRVVPARLAAAGHTFRYPDLEGALRHVLGRVADRGGVGGY